MLDPLLRRQELPFLQQFNHCGCFAARQLFVVILNQKGSCSQRNEGACRGDKTKQSTNSPTVLERQSGKFDQLAAHSR